MATTLDVLLIESEPGAGDADAHGLESAGHRLHRCYPANTLCPSPRVSLRDRYLCTGVTSGCRPLDGSIDVALLVRSRLATQPGWREAGVSCALRAGVSVVEDGPDVLRPYEPWFAGRVTEELVAACEAAADRGFATLAGEVSLRSTGCCGPRESSPATCCAGSNPPGPDSLRVLFTGPHLPRRSSRPCRSGRSTPFTRAYLRPGRCELSRALRMSTPSDDTSGPTLEEMSREECFQLMASLSIGRVAVGRHDEPPLVVPVNYILDGEVIVFRSDPGTKIIALRRAAHQLPGRRRRAVPPRGWSVLVTGIAYEATALEVEHPHRRAVGWRRQQHWVRELPQMVTGRRIRLPEIRTSDRGYL